MPTEQEHQTSRALWESAIQDAKVRIDQLEAEEQRVKREISRLKSAIRFMRDFVANDTPWPEFEEPRKEQQP